MGPINYFEADDQAVMDWRAGINRPVALNQTTGASADDWIIRSIADSNDIWNNLLNIVVRMDLRHLVTVGTASSRELAEMRRFCDGRNMFYHPAGMLFMFSKKDHALMFKLQFAGQK